MKLNNTVIVITGAAQGLGLAMANTFAKAGANIALIDMQEDAVKQAAKEISELGVNAIGYALNVTDEEQVESTFNQIVSDFGKINGLINSAGIMRDGMLLKVKDGKVEPLPRKQSLEELTENLLICPVNEMIDKLSVYAEAGVDEIIISAGFGQSQNEMIESMHRISEEVIPYFKKFNTQVA